MLFNSYEFLFLYLPIVTGVFFLFARSSHRGATLWLVGASLFFYGWWNPHFVLLLLGSISFNYGMGYAISKKNGATGKRKTTDTKNLLIFALAINILLLGYFKYTNFFIITVNSVVDTEWALTDIVLPLGISFFTFTQIAFLVDAYRGIAKEYSFIHYLLFVTYFPHLIAGPVLHHKEMMPQFADREIYRFSSENVFDGLSIFTIGLAKKILLADNFAIYSASPFVLASQGTQPAFVDAWVAAISYAFQIYFDFSGYSTMAIGLSCIFGVKLPANFNYPYKAESVIEFWHRWHMTLSRFLRDYLYIPLGGNRRGTVRRFLNFLITMILGGVWHGANWTFVIWGALHGAYLLVNHLWRNMISANAITLPRLFCGAGRFFAACLTFFVVVIAWVFFRADSVEAAQLMLRGMVKISFSGATNSSRTLAALLFVFMGMYFLPPVEVIVHRLNKFLPFRRLVESGYPYLMAGIFSYCVLQFSKKSEFIYFQF